MKLHHRALRAPGHAARSILNPHGQDSPVAAARGRARPHEAAQRFLLLSVLATAVWAATAAPARASDDHGAAKPAKPAAAAAHAAPVAPSSAPSHAPAHAPAATAAAKPAPAAASADAANDGLVIVHRRLVQKFASQPGVEAGASSPVVRVTSRAGGVPAHPVAGAHGAHTSPRAATAPTKRDAAHAAHWSYDGEGGPADWGRMKPEFAACSVGKRQSPIDIREGIKLSLDPVTFDYKPTSFKVQDNGHTIQVNLPAGNSIDVMGERYELVQFHFHRPSEESIDGRRFDMVAHFVHKSLEGRLAVVAVLIERGSAQGQLQQVWNNLPLEKGDTVNARGTLDLERLLPADRGYFTYMGSLTTPPCSEGVLWMVMKQPVQASSEQLGVFARLYPMNARPVQSASGRLIKESN
jgi:carbonic anhydrase